MRDWFAGKKAPEATYSTWQWKLVGVSGVTIPANSYVILEVGTPDVGKVWQIYNARVDTKDNPLLGVGIEWSDMVVYRAWGFGSAVLEMPKGLDYKNGNYLRIHAINPNGGDLDVFVSFSGVEVLE